MSNRIPHGAVLERRRDASRLLALECIQSAVGVGLLVVVAVRGIVMQRTANVSTGLAIAVGVELLLAVVAGIVLLGLGFRARMGRELILVDIARLDAAARSAAREELAGPTYPYRTPTGCSVCRPRRGA
jgi:hypothetical protein